MYLQLRCHEILSERNPFLGFPSNARYTRGHPSKEHYPVYLPLRYHEIFSERNPFLRMDQAKRLH
jgi:hypothetical protein